MNHKRGNNVDRNARLSGIDSESGMAMVVFGLWMLVIFGFAAYSLDTSRIFNEHAELRNGADAAALAIAEDCAFGNCGGFYDEYGVAELYADANATDSAAWVENVDIDLAAQMVTVEVATEDSDGDNNFDMVLAHIIGYNGLTVRADATAGWTASIASPVTISMCETTDPATGALLPVGPANPVSLVFHDDPAAGTCGHSSSGEDIDGGFGWLAAGSDCSVPMQGRWVSGHTSVDPPTSAGCDMHVLRSLLQGDVMLPIYDDVVGIDGGGGANTRYHIPHFALFHVTDFKIYTDTRHQGVSTLWNDPSCFRPAGGGSQTVCIDGYFVAHEVPSWIGADITVSLLD